MASLDETAASSGHNIEDMNAALREVQKLDPAGVGARDVRECLLLQLESRNGRGVAWQIGSDHLKLLESRQLKERPGSAGRSSTSHLVQSDPGIPIAPGVRYSASGARQVERDVHIFKDGDEWIIQLNDEDLPQLRLKRSTAACSTAARSRAKKSAIMSRSATVALQSMKNIEQRKQTILRVCQLIGAASRNFSRKALISSSR